MDESREGRNLAQAGEPVREEGVLPVLRVLLLPQASLGVGGQVRQTGEKQVRQVGHGGGACGGRTSSSLNRYSGGGL